MSNHAHIGTSSADAHGIGVQTALRKLDPELFRIIQQLARAEQLLVATDYDGTIAPIVDSPAHAYPKEESVQAMRALAELDNTTSAVISGRSLRDLAAMSRLPREVHLVGSHGGETDTDFEESLSRSEQHALSTLRHGLASVQAAMPALNIEPKPSGAAIHLRGLEGPQRRQAEEAVARLEALSGVRSVRGKEVVDLTVVDSTKGDALNKLRRRLDQPTVLYIGDDASDEPAFASLGEDDLGLKVTEVAAENRHGENGNGVETAARFLLSGPDEVALVLSSVVALRRAWLFGKEAVPIERYTLLSNGTTTALVDPTAQISWLPHPLPHSDSLFSEILGSDDAGYFSVVPAREPNALPISQRYRDATHILETRWQQVSVTDYLAPVADGDPAGSAVLVRALKGEGEALIRFAPRPDYGAYPVRLKLTDRGVRVRGVAEAVELVAPDVQFKVIQDGESETAIARVKLKEDAPVVLALILGAAENTAAAVLGDEAAVRASVKEESREWVEALSLPTKARDRVGRSALTLRGLCHAPTGGILAAATTSLPEGIGGVRNWDYRYTWLRDGALTASALVDLGSAAEARGFLQWLDAIIAQAAEQSMTVEELRPLYAVDGSQLVTEAVLEHLPGYAGSRPVRVGNAAEHQVQLDVFGPVADLIVSLARFDGTLSDSHWKLLEDLVQAVANRWHQADHGIWEARRAPKHNVYTKVMCWQTVDRALKAAEEFGRPAGADWEQLREDIKNDVCSKGFNSKVGAFTVAYGEDDLDAACLFVGLSGMLPADDERFRATVDAVERSLREGPTVFRYRYDDGLPGLEGGFHICTSWLIESLQMVGRTADARNLFNRMEALIGPTGMLPEEYDPVAERHLGNTPQAYSHIGHIKAAIALSE